MKYTLNNHIKNGFLLAMTLSLSNCNLDNDTSDTPEIIHAAAITEVGRIDNIKAELSNTQSKKVMVVAHRGDWRHAPENSLQAIKNCIDMGVDIVEIDIRKTKDGHLVVIHDKTLDRTTTGQGKVADWTLDSLKTLYLKNGLGRASNHRIPTLEEAMLASKGKIMVNLDKSYDYFAKVYNILEKTGTTDHVVIKGSKAFAQVQEDFGQYLDKVLFMPIIHLETAEASQIIEDYSTKLAPVAMEFVFSSDTISMLNMLSKVQKNGSRVWINSLWASLNGGHDDNRAVDDLAGSYDWILEHHATMIQTDRPQLLLRYLRSKGLHD